METTRWMTHSLRTSQWGQRASRVLEAAIHAVDPGKAVRRFFERSGDMLRVDGREYDLNNYRRVLVIGAGKAGAPMARAARNILAERLTGGLVIVKEGYASADDTNEDSSIQKISIVEAGHPLPDERGVSGTQQLIKLLEGAHTDDLVICMVSGGGSALLVSPAPGLTLDDLQHLTSALLASGATINEINALRKHLDVVKGGGLARLAAPATLVTLILSDVVGDPLDVIASGPTVPDSSTFAGAYQVLESYGILDKVPQAIITLLQSGMQGLIPETPKPGDALFSNIQNVIVGSNQQAAQASLLQAQAEGFQALLLTTFLQGEARQAGRMLASIARQVAKTGQPIPRPACIIAGGETTVTLLGDGLGGRNQEMALSAVSELNGLPDLALITLATDGGDGPTDAAGAVVTGETLVRARQLGMNPVDFLSRNDSYHFFAALDDLLCPGPTQTNVNDLGFIFAF